MQRLNYKNHNAKDIASRIVALDTLRKKEDFANKDGVGCICASIRLWFEENPDARSDPEKRKILKNFYTAIADMGGFMSPTNIDCLLERDEQEAEERGDSEALERINEEKEFWETVRFFIREARGGGYFFAGQLVEGRGCEKDVERAEKIYEDLYFARVETLDEAHRALLRDARDGKLDCKMTPFKSRALDALLDGDRARFAEVFFEAERNGAVNDVIATKYTMVLLDHYERKA